MLYITSSYTFNSRNELEIKEIYVTDTEYTYVMRYETGFSLIKYKYNVLETQRPVFTKLAFGPVRQYLDDDARTLARFFQENITKVPMHTARAHKALFEMLSNFGEEVSDGV